MWIVDGNIDSDCGVRLRLHGMGSLNQRSTETVGQHSMPRHGVLYLHSQIGCS